MEERRRPVTRMPAAKRRAQLLDRAAELFATHGYARTTTAEIARAAGVTEPIIYRHFESKRGLFIALIERTGERTLDLWTQHLEDAKDPADRVRRLIGDNPMVSPEGRDAYRVFLQAITEVDGDDGVAEAVRAHIGRVHAFLEQELEAAQRAGRVPRRFSAQVLAWVLLSTGLGYGVLEAMGVKGHNVDRGGVHVQQVIARALVGRSRESERGRGDGDGGRGNGAT